MLQDHADCPVRLQFHLTANHLSGAFPETCEPACKALFEPFYAEYEATCRPLTPCHADASCRCVHRCEERIAAEPYQANEDDGRAYANFLAVCQAAPGGGGH